MSFIADHRKSIQQKPSHEDEDGGAPMPRATLPPCDTGMPQFLAHLLSQGEVKPATRPEHSSSPTHQVAFYPNRFIFNSYIQYSYYISLEAADLNTIGGLQSPGCELTLFPFLKLDKEQLIPTPWISHP